MNDNARRRDQGVTPVVIDTAPHASAGALAASKLSDLVLVPCRPSAPDLAAIGAREREIDRIMNRTPRRPPQRGPDRDVGPSR